MSILRVLAITFFIIIAVYTGFVVANHGGNLLPVYFADLFSVDWTGQFVLDFTGYLVLSALWIMWRHRFSATGIVLGAVAPFGGMLFFALYLLVAAGRANGDMKVLLLGRENAGADI